MQGPRGSEGSVLRTPTVDPTTSRVEINGRSALEYAICECRGPSLLRGNREGMSVARSTRGMVASPHALATAAGAAVLRAGGNAVDAAVATNGVLSVVFPQANGLGGDAFWMIYD